MKKIDTFSANSLKVLDKNLEEFINKYIYNLSFYKKDNRARIGELFHSLICAYIKGFEINKMILELDEKNLSTWKNLEKILKDKKNNFIKTEYSFLIKDELNDKPYFLTGRFDAIYKKNDEIIIYDWKTLNIPKNPCDELQSIVYLYCANKIFKTQKIKMRYLSIEKLEFVDVLFEDNLIYKNRIDEIIKKFYDIID